MAQDKKVNFFPGRSIEIKSESLSQKEELIFDFGDSYLLNQYRNISQRYVTNLLYEAKDWASIWSVKELFIFLPIRVCSEETLRGHLLLTFIATAIFKSYKMIF